MFNISTKLRRFNKYIKVIVLWGDNKFIFTKLNIASTITMHAMVGINNYNCPLNLSVILLATKKRF